MTTKNNQTNNMYTLNTTEQKRIKSTLENLQKDAYAVLRRQSSERLADGLQETDTASLRAYNDDVNGCDNYRTIAHRAEDTYRVQHGLNPLEYFPLELVEVNTANLVIALAVRVTAGYLVRTYSKMGSIRNIEYLREPMFDDLVGVVLLAWAEEYGYDRHGVCAVDDKAGMVGGRALSQYLNRSYTAGEYSLSYGGTIGTPSTVEQSTVDPSEKSFNASRSAYFKTLDDIYRAFNADDNGNVSYSVEYTEFWQKMSKILRDRAKANKRFDKCYKAFKLKVYKGLGNAEIAKTLGVGVDTVNRYGDTWQSIAHDLASDTDCIINK